MLLLRKPLRRFASTTENRIWSKTALIGGFSMADIHLSIRIDLASGGRIGPGKIALLEAVRSTNSISAAARSIEMSYRKAWLLVDEINQVLRKPAVMTEIGGSKGGGATVTPAGEKIISLYRLAESQARAAVGGEFRAIEKLVRERPTSR
jgi:molybdate transport system regulatory protein